MANPNIYAQYAQPVRSVQDYADQLDMADTRRQQNALQRLHMQRQMQADAAAADEQNALAALWQGMPQDASPQQRAEYLMRNPRTYGQGVKAYGDVAEAEQKAAAAKASRYKLTSEQRERAIRDTASLASPDQARESLRAAVMRGDINEQEAAAMANAIPNDPVGFLRWQVRTVAALAAPDKQVELMTPQLQTRDTGGAVQTLAVDRVTGVPAVTGTVQKTQSPDNRASVGAQLAIADAGRQQATATRDAARITARAGDETALRKEFADLPEVKKYKAAIPAYKAIEEAAKSRNPQADINLIYGLAKLYDPDSVVREGEYATIANSQAIPEWLKGQAQALIGGGKLTDETKRQVLQQARIRFDTFRSEYDGAKTSFDAIAKDRGFNPANVFPAVGAQVTAPAAAPKPGGPSVSNW